MLERERKYHVAVAIVMFFALLFVDKITEAILMLIIGHLIEIKYELKKINSKKTIE